MSPHNDPRRRPPAGQGPGQRAPRGFTLIELLVSLLLLGLVMGLVYGSFFQISRGATQVESSLTERQDLRLLLKIVGDDLQSAVWLEQFWQGGQRLGQTRATGIVAHPEVVDGKEFSALSFHVAENTRFYRRVVPAADPGLHEVGYSVRRVQEGEEGHGLELVRREDFYLDDDLQHGGISVPLADRIDTFLVEFLPPEADPSALEDAWQKDWDSTTRPADKRMPKAIRLTIGRLDAAGKTHQETLEINLNASLKGD